MAEQHFGTYQTFSTASKEDGGALMNADNLVGARYGVEFKMEDGEHRAWLLNPFGHRVGFFEPAFSRQLEVMAAGGLKVAALLSYVGFRNTKGEEGYFGECVVLAYPPAQEEAYDRFMEGLGARLGDGTRPRLDFGTEGARRIVESGGSWQPQQTLGPIPKQEGVVVLKDKRGFGDKMVEAGRARNPGCYAGSVAFLLVLAGLVAWAVVSCVDALS